jgi:hypothetical protein
MAINVPLLLNFVCFQVVWFVTLQAAAGGRAWIGLLALAAFVAVQARISRVPGADLRLAACAALGGLLVDTLFIQGGLLRYASPGPLPALAPAWILAMWANFGLTLNSSLGWLQGRAVLAAGLGAVGGPMAYLAGVKIGAATLAAPPLAVYGGVAIAWGIATPVLLDLAVRFARSDTARA